MSWVKNGLVISDENEHGYRWYNRGRGKTGAPSRTFSCLVPEVKKKVGTSSSAFSPIASEETKENGKNKRRKVTDMAENEYFRGRYIANVVPWRTVTPEDLMYVDKEFKNPILVMTQRQNTSMFLSTIPRSPSATL